MPDTVFAEIRIAQGTTVQLASTPPGARQPWCDLNSGRFGVGDVMAATSAALNTITASTAGTTTLPLLSQIAHHFAVVQIAAGAGAFTRNIVLPESVTGIDAVTACAPVNGDSIKLRVEIAASANPSVPIYTAAATGTPLVSLAGDVDAARTYICEFSFNGAWQVFDVRQFNP